MPRQSYALKSSRVTHVFQCRDSKMIYSLRKICLFTISTTKYRSAWSLHLSKMLDAYASAVAFCWSDVPRNLRAAECRVKYFLKQHLFVVCLLPRPRANV
ncbi:hypothetical protein EVAR_61910_1 [Eumeta japonica]|uniref:Uncharacterized protein n=1 Tax=Eumeta variegata TaxID=151549 RepID=A0A4C1YMA9_EUMVA|nr:hypothetical protein EVAR_61910_1 [Eumeta japonica]